MVLRQRDSMVWWRPWYPWRSWRARRRRRGADGRTGARGGGGPRVVEVTQEHVQLRTDELIVDVSVPRIQEQIKWDAGVGSISALSVDDKHIEERVSVDQYSEQLQTIYDSHVSDSPSLPRTEEKSARAPVDVYDNRHIEEWVPVDQYSEQQRAIHDSLESNSPPHPRTEETSSCASVDDYNRHTEERVPVDQYSQRLQTTHDSHVPDSPPCPPLDKHSEQQQTTHDSHVSDPPPLLRTEEKCARFPVDESDEELVVNVDGQETVLDIVFDAICELTGEGDWVALCARFRRRLSWGWSG